MIFAKFYKIFATIDAHYGSAVASIRNISYFSDNQNNYCAASTPLYLASNAFQVRVSEELGFCLLKSSK